MHFLRTEHVQLIDLEDKSRGMGHKEPIYCGIGEAGIWLGASPRVNHIKSEDQSDK